MKIYLYIINFFIHIFLSVLIIFFCLYVFEKKLSKQQLTLLPSNLAEFKILENGYKMMDGKSNAFESSIQKKNIIYKHDKNGFRVNSQNINKYRDTNFSETVFVIGDSILYGLNINVKDTIYQRVANQSKYKKVYNFSFPGIDILEINAKLECLKSIILNKKEKAGLLILGLTLNDFKNYSVFEYDLDNKFCAQEGLKSMNLNKIPLKVYNNRNETTFLKQNKNLKILRYFKKYYPYLYKKMQTFVYINFDFNSYLFKKFNYDDFLFFKNQEEFEDVVNIKLYKWQLNKFKKNISSLETYFDKIIIIYFPGDETEIKPESNIKNYMSVAFKFFNDLKKNNTYNKVDFIDAGSLIYLSLDKYDLSNFEKKKILPSKYYSYLKEYDFVHPSAFTSKIYADKVLNLIKK